MRSVARCTWRRVGIGLGTGLGVTALAPLDHSKAVAACAGDPKPCPAFSMTAQRYDQSTYQGRLFAVLEKIDPRTLVTTDEEVKRCQALLDAYQASGRLPEGQSDADMWEARRIVEAVIHPVAKEPMFALGRMSAFVPMNAPIAALMLNARSMPAVIFSQWLNQSYNVMNNYVNRSSLEVAWSGLLQPYCLAVAVSCSLALLGRRATRALPQLGLFVPYFAVISAGSCNVAFTRMDEWCGRGVCIFSEEGKELGTSLKAGQQAVFKTIATRSWCLPIPVLLVPPLVMSALPLTGTAAMLAELSIIIASLSVALPCALAILPQEMEVSVASLEAEYQSLVDSQGKPITRVFANKGL